MSFAFSYFASGDLSSSSGSPSSTMIVLQTCFFTGLAAREFGALISPEDDEKALVVISLLSSYTGGASLTVSAAEADPVAFSVDTDLDVESALAAFDVDSDESEL